MSCFFLFHLLHPYLVHGASFLDRQIFVAAFDTNGILRMLFMALARLHARDGTVNLVSV